MPQGSLLESANSGTAAGLKWGMARSHAALGRWPDVKPHANNVCRATVAFPLTPALSLGERENPSPTRDEPEHTESLRARTMRFPLLGAEHYPDFGVQFRPIPKGLDHLAQGWTAGEQGGGPTLGNRPQQTANPERVAASRSDGQHHCRNPFRVEESCNHRPRVARASQPWAGGWNPFGIRPGEGGQRCG